uniref:DDB1- and CUL4-associated factor 12 beta-propeller domain-containing protein n=2 Tax=Plectus sambesii TaxID=2011161 RepID=A0A914XDF3_9BILA
MNVQELWSLRERGLAGVSVKTQESNWWSKRNCPVLRTCCVYDKAGKFSADPVISCDDALRESVSSRLPSLLHERKLELSGVNKVFASQWLDQHRIVLGTKCNRIVVARISSQLDDAAEATSSRKRDRSGRLLTGASSANSNTSNLMVEQIANLKSSAGTLWNAQEAGGHSGIHAIRINPSGTRMATGGECPSDVAVYSLPDLQPVTIGETGHSDWMFDLQWLDDEFAVSGSRDGSIALWRFEEQTDDAKPCSHVPWVRMAKSAHTSWNVYGPHHSWNYPTTRPITTRRLGHQFDRVRTLVFSQQSRAITCASLSSHMCVIDSATFQKKGKTKVLDSSEFSETVCMCHSSDERCLALGSRAHFTVFESDSLRPVVDVRLPDPLRDIAAHYPGLAPSGVRSISWRGPVITMGTGGGELLFFDIRMSRFLECSGHSCRQNVTLRVGGGWLQDDEILEEMLTSSDCPTAVYTHSYDSSGMRLFAAGGPIAASIQGNYAAVWQ